MKQQHRFERVFLCDSNDLCYTSPPPLRSSRTSCRCAIWLTRAARRKGREENSEQEARERARKEALVQQQVKDDIIDPAAAKAEVAKDDLSSKFSALGASISSAR